MNGTPPTGGSPPDGPLYADPAENARMLLDALDHAIDEVYREAADPAYTPDEQERLVRAGRALRRQYAALAGMAFDANTAGYAAAAGALDAIDAQLREVIDRVNDLTAFLSLVGRLAAALDTIVRAATPA